MKIFHCGECDQLVFFENVKCLSCEHALAYLPDQADVAALEWAGDGLWRVLGAAPEKPPAAGEPASATAPIKGLYRVCRNYTEQNVCNWAVPADDPNPYCLSCRLTPVIPDLSQPGHKDRWGRLELAKRRLIYSLLGMSLPVRSKLDDPAQGLSFQFLADPPKDKPDAKPVLTGHADGVITINIAEADSAEREKRRVQMHEPYRTLLGHFRHEVGHYYWDRLIKTTDRLGPFREQFGDERADYGEALQRHYKNGPPADWAERFISAYATCHPWEDWAESWAHYLHMVDTLETAAACGLSLRPRRADEPSMKTSPSLVIPGGSPFDLMIRNWYPLTYVLNNLNRGLGMPDGYPFVLSGPVVEKLRFIHDTVTAAA